MSYQPVRLEIAFSSYYRGVAVRWHSDEALGVRQSQMPLPIAAADLPLVQRALDVLQDPSYPAAWTDEQERLCGFAPRERERLRALGFWDDGDVVPIDLPRRVGRRLYLALTRDPAGAEAMGSVRSFALATGRPLLIECLFHTHTGNEIDIALAGTPWELLWANEPTPLLAESRLEPSIERRLTHTGAPPPPHPRSGALRILAVAPRAGIAPELRQIERSARLSAWAPLLDRRLAEMRELGPVSRADLERAVREWSPDVVHYYGHGRYEGGVGALLLDSAGGAEDWVPTAALAAALGRVRMVLLHACQGAMAAPGGALLSSIAPALSAAGVPVVLGMQFTVRADAATLLAKVIYAGLAQGRSIQESLATARRMLYVNEVDPVSWFVPTLYIRSRSHEPLYLRPPSGQPLALTLGGRQSVLARGRSTIKRLRIQGLPGGRQVVLASGGAQISDVSMRQVAP